MASFTFVPANAVTPLSTGSTFIPSPWLQDPSATDESSVVADASITVSGGTVFNKIKDGWRWVQLGNPTFPYGYARTEIALTRQIGTIPFPAGVMSTITWSGYFTTALPEGTTGEYFTSPFQIHNSANAGSPRYEFTINTSNATVYFEVHDTDGAFEYRVPVLSMNDMVGESEVKTLKAYYRPNSAADEPDGSITIELNGRYICHEAGKVTSVNTGFDICKFGIYDWTNAVTDPDNTGGTRELTLGTTYFNDTN